MIISDIDGTVLYHHGDIETIIKEDAIVLPGAREKLQEARDLGHYILLVTGRPESLLVKTMAQLSEFNIPFDSLLMGVHNDIRYIINDTKPYRNLDTTCVAITVERNKGLEGIDICER